MAVRDRRRAGGLRRIEPLQLAAVGQRPLSGHRESRLGALLLRPARWTTPGCVRELGVVPAVPVAPPAAARAGPEAGDCRSLGVGDRRAGDAGRALERAAP